MRIIGCGLIPHSLQWDMSRIRELWNRLISRFRNKDRDATAWAEPGRKKRFRKRYILYSFLAILTIVYLYVMRAGFLEPLIKDAFAKASYGQIELKITKASLFRGFRAEDIRILSGPEFGGAPALEIKELRLDYGLWRFLIADFRIKEIGIYEPRIYLIEKNGRNNLASLMRPPQTPPEEEPEEPAGEPLTELPVAIRGGLKFILNDLDVFADLDGRKSSVQNLSFAFEVRTNRFSKIPGPGDITEVLQLLDIRLNPDNKLQIESDTRQAQVSTALNLRWITHYEPGQPFKSEMNWGSQEIPVRLAGRNRTVLGFTFAYDMFYNPDADTFTIRDFSVRLADERWLQLNGTVSAVRNNAKFDIRLPESEILLRRLYDYMNGLTGKSAPRFSGSISVAPLAVTGTMADLNINGNILIRNLSFRAPGTSLSIPRLDSNYTILLNLKEKSPLIRFLLRMRGSIASAPLNLDAEFAPGSKVFLDLSLRNLQAGPLSGNAVTGPFTITANVKGPSEKNINALFRLSSPAFRYYMGRSRSGNHRMNLDITASVKNSGSLVAEPDVKFSLKNADGDESVHLDLHAEARSRPGNAETTVSLNDLTISLPALYVSAPPALQDGLRPALNFIKRDIRLSSLLNLVTHGRETRITNDTTFRPSDKLSENLTLKADVMMNPGDIRIRQIKLRGLADALSADVSGRVYRNRPDVNLDLYLGQKSRRDVYQGNFISGAMRLNARFDGEAASGVFRIDNFNFDNGLPGEFRNPRFTRVKNVNMEFPFRHRLKYNVPLDTSGDARERLLKNYHFQKPANFTIESVSVENPAIPGEAMQLLTPGSGHPGLYGYLEYKDNHFNMPYMRIHTLNGLVNVADVSVNLGRMIKEDQAFYAVVQIKDIDLKQLIPREKQQGIKDGSVRADMAFQGRGFDQPNSSLNGYFSVYHLGKQFMRQALRIVSPGLPSRTMDYLVRQVITVEQMNVALREGLVYATIQTSGMVEPINQERLTLTEFLRRSREEAAIYR